MFKSEQHSHTKLENKLKEIESLNYQEKELLSLKPVLKANKDDLQTLQQDILI